MLGPTTLPASFFAALAFTMVIANPVQAEIRTSGEGSLGIQGLSLDSNSGFGDIEGVLLHFGTKLGFHSTNHGWFAQIDGSFNGFDIEWFEPNANLDGKIHEFSGWAHLGYSINEEFKIGIFGAVLRHDITFDPASLGGISLFLEFDSIAYGIEAIYKPNADWKFGTILGLVDVNKAILGAGLSGGPIAVLPIPGTNDTGWLAGGTIEYRHNEKWVLGLAAHGLEFDVPGGGEFTVFDIVGSIEYLFGTSPWSLLTSIGYYELESGTGNPVSFQADGIAALARLKYRFGETPDSVRGELFNSYTFFGRAH